MRQTAGAFLAFLSSLVAFLMVSGCESRGPRFSHNEIQALESAMVAGDTAAAVAIYMDDAAILLPNQPAVTGPEKIRAFYEQYKLNFQHDFLFDIVSEGVEQGGDIAVDYGIYRARDLRVGKIVETGKYLTVWQRSDGTWKIWRSMWNSDGTEPSLILTAG